LHTHGGLRPGAGRKPGPRPQVPRVARPAVASRFPVHVTLRLLENMPSLRQEPVFGVLCDALAAGADRLGMRIVEYSAQGDHLHLIAEARDSESLHKGMQGLSIRIAKAINRLMGRKGKVFADRYHVRILKTPREVRNALLYALNNAHRHAVAAGRRPPEGVDPYSSGPWFDGWREPVVSSAAGPRVSVPGRTWLLTTGWRRYGLLGVGELPGAKRRSNRATPN
jgi:REP-associated tyrosine transposase